MTTTTKPKSPQKSPRKAAPRKAASRTRAAGATSGDPTPVNGAGVAPAPENDNAAPTNGEVRESALPQDNSGMIQSPYPPDTPTYTFFPVFPPDKVKLAQQELGLTEEQVQAPMIIPKFTTLKPKTRWLDSIYDLGPIAQAFEWMRLAKVPAAIRTRVFWMDDEVPEEYKRFWDGWFGEAKITQGESPR